MPSTVDEHHLLREKTYLFKVFVAFSDLCRTENPDIDDLCLKTLPNIFEEPVLERGHLALQDK